MKKITFLFIMTFIALSNINAQHLEITKVELPNNVIEFIDKYYQEYGNPIIFVEYDSYRNNKVDEFEVHYTNGTVLEFDKKGFLKSIDCGTTDSISINVLPINVRNTFNKINVSKLKIVELTIDRRRNVIDYEIELENGIDYTFNKYGKLKRD
jgi:hypothetical protein